MLSIFCISMFGSLINTGSAADPDVYESNDDPSTATNIDIFSGEYFLTIHEITDLDCFNFTLSVGDQFTFAISYTELDLEINYYDPNGDNLGFIIADTLNLGIIVFTASLNGFYCFKIESINELTGNYVFNPLSDDGYEDDDSLNTAKLVDSSSIYQNLRLFDDDWFYFPISFGQITLFYIDSIKSSVGNTPPLSLEVISSTSSDFNAYTIESNGYYNIDNTYIIEYLSSITGYLGIHIYRADNYISDTILTNYAVCITQNTPQTLSVNSPIDLIIATNNGYQAIPWIVTQIAGLSYSGSYYVSDGSTKIGEGEWRSDENIAFPVWISTPGDYSYTIIATDGTSLIQDEVIISCYSNVAETLDVESSSVTMSFGEIGVVSNWTIHSSGTVTSGSYSILNSETDIEIISGIWNSGDSILWSLDGLDIGSYTYTFIANDGTNTVAQDLCVNVLDTGIFSINSPVDISYILGDLNAFYIEWIVNSTGIIQSTYSISMNGTDIINTDVWNSGQLILYNVGSSVLTSPGTYEYTISAYNNTDFIYDTVIVNVISPGMVMLSSPADISYMAYDPGSYYINWFLNSTYINTGSYKILQNGSELLSDTWWNETSYGFDVSGFTEPGEYEFTFWATDGDFCVSDTVVLIISVPLYTLSINSPLDITVVEGAVDLGITWTVKATGFTTGVYSLYVDGIFITKNTWSADISFSFPVNGSKIGQLNYTIEISNKFANITDTVIVSIIAYNFSISTPDDVTYTRGTKGHYITWRAFSNNVSSNFYSITRNGTSSENGTWIIGTELVVNIDGLTLGTYLFVINITDGRSSISDNVLVVVISNEISINSPEDKIITKKTTGNVIHWIISSSNRNITGSYSIFKNGTLISSGIWISGINITLSVDELDIGYYLFEINATDGYSSVLDIVNVYIFPVVIDTPFNIAGFDILFMSVLLGLVSVALATKGIKKIHH